MLLSLMEPCRVLVTAATADFELPDWENKRLLFEDRIEQINNCRQPQGTWLEPRLISMNKPEICQAVDD